MQESGGVEVPCDEIRATGELEVLVRLVDADTEPVAAQPARLEFAHRRVDRLSGEGHTTIVFPAPIRQPEVEAQAERDRYAYQCLE